MDDEEGQRYSTRSNVEPRWVKMSTAQLDELTKALDDTRTLLKNLQRSCSEAQPSLRPVTGQPEKSWWGRHCWPRKRRVLYQNITLITVLLQFLNLMILTVLDLIPSNSLKEHIMIYTSSTTMIVLQVANLWILIMATGRLAQQVIHHSVNSFFLAQSYMATLLVFAGLYTLTYRLDKHSWKFVNENNVSSHPIQVVRLYLKFLFYSISTATLCGADNALAMYWYNDLFSGTQMLLSFCYFASILGIAVSPRQPEMRQAESSDSSVNNQSQRYHQRPQTDRPGSNLDDLNADGETPISPTLRQEVEDNQRQQQQQQQ